MRKMLIKVLTLSMLLSATVFAAPEVVASIVKQERAKTHLRWNFFTSKDNLVIQRRGQKLLLKTLNTDVFNKAKESFSTLEKMPRYIKSVRFLEPQEENNVSTIEITMASDNVEVFNFYRARDQKHVFDFWKENTDEELYAEKKAETQKAPPSQEASKKAPPKLLKRPEKKPVVKKAPTKKESPKLIVRNPGYRDFRYGAPFIWDYDPFGPEFKINFDLRTKTPEHFYPIKNRDYTKSDKEAHLQLAINLYRKKKYGLMYKSIKLFREKYGADEDIDLIEYLKANAILRDNIDKGELEPKKMAINMLSSIAGRTKNYDLQKAIYKYLLAFYKKNKEHVKGLSTAKRFYVTSKENFDYEESQYAADAILYNLSELNQVDKVAEVIKEKTIRKILPSSKLLAYEIYVNHRLGHLDKVLSMFKDKEKGLAKPVEASILFNVAEAYFRKADYDTAIKLFDEFITEHSYHTKTSHARARIALSYEITEKDINQTIVLYKNAINRSQDSLVSAEARIRYAALRSVRKRDLKESDIENRAFLNIDKNVVLTPEHKKLLWITRLRTFIVDENYDRALTYLSALPLTSLKETERRVFQADGAEIVYGIIRNEFLNSEYSQVVKDWNKYKTRYIRKVANDPFMNFIVGKSYLKLGLYEGFEDLYSDFKKLDKTPLRTFPLWVSRDRSENPDEMLYELEVVKNIKLKNYDLARKGIAKIRRVNKDNNMVNYYLGTIEFKKNDYKAASRYFEAYLSNQKERTIFDPMELAALINMYTDSLYELDRLDKFQKVTKAILSDTANYAPTNPFMKEMRERLEYLNIEIEAGKGSAAASVALEPVILKFKERYPDSSYMGRVNYLLGMAFAKNKKPQEARTLFEKILQDQNTPATIKELVKSELSLMAIKERTI